MIDRLKNMSLKTMTIILIVVTALVFAGGLSVYMYESQFHVVYADDDEDTSTLSFYSTASSFARVMGYIASPDFGENVGTTEEEKTNNDNKKVEGNNAQWGHVRAARSLFKEKLKTSNDSASVGTASSLLGYFDKGDGAGFFGFIQTMASGTNTDYNYRALRKYPNLGDPADPDSASTAQNALYGYGLYGYGLHCMGFDATAGSSLGLMRWAAGIPFFLAFLLCFAVDFIFKVVLFILNAINPFALFANVSIDAINGGGGYDNINTAGNAFGNASDPNSLISMISSLYESIANISLYVLIPMFIALCAFTFLVLKKVGNSKSMLKKIIIRLLFVVIGIPILASFYTSSLSQLSESTAGASNAAQITAATFFDFEAWVYQNVPLEAYEKITFLHNEKGGTVDLNTNMYLKLQDYCYEFNTKTKAIAGSANAIYDTSSSSRLESNLSNKLDTNGTSESDFTSCVGILSRYMFGKKITASTYESDIKTQRYNGNAYSKILTGLRRVRYNKYKDKDDHSTFGLFSDYSDEDNVLNGRHANSNNSVLAVVFGKNDALISGIEGDVKNLVTGNLGVEISEKEVTFSGGGLSYLGTYNFLNTDFDEKSMSVYSPGAASSIFVMKVHYSVNMIGTGLLSFWYWAYGCVSLVCLAILGFAYGFGILFGNLKRGFKILMQVPFATLGAMKAIARVISWTIMMILEIMVTLFLYQLLSEIFLSIPKIVASPIVNLMTDKNADGTAVSSTVSSAIRLPGTNMAIGGYMLTIFILGLSVIADILFTILALKLRKSVVKSIDEEAARIVEQVIGVGNGAASELPKQPGMLGNLASNALTAGGASMAMDKLSGGSGAAFEKSASAGENVEGFKEPVGTGSGEEESDVGKEAVAGEDGNPENQKEGENSEQEGSQSKENDKEGGSAEKSDGAAPAGATSAAKKDETDKKIAESVIQSNSLGGAGSSSTGDTLTDNSDTVNNYEGGDNTSESETSAENKSEVSSDENNAVPESGKEKEVVLAEDQKEKQSGPTDINNADTNQIAKAAREGSGDSKENTAKQEGDKKESNKQESDKKEGNRQESNKIEKSIGDNKTENSTSKNSAGKPGEGGEGGDGAKGEDGKDADADKRDTKSVHGHSEPEKGAYQDEKGQWHHANGDKMTKAEAKAHKAELSAQQAEEDWKEQKKHRFDGTKKDKENAEKQVKASQQAVADLENNRVEADRKGVTFAGRTVKKGDAAKQDAHLQTLNEATQRHEESKNSAQKRHKKAQASKDAALDKAHAETVSEQKEKNAKADKDIEKRGKEKEKIANSVTAMKREGEAKERTHQARMKQRFPHAVDHQGNFHPEALRGLDKARYNVLEAGHGKLMQNHQNKIDKAQGKADAKQNKIDSLEEKKKQGERKVEASKAAVSAGKAANEATRKAKDEASAQKAKRKDDASLAKKTAKDEFTLSDARVDKAKSAQKSAKKAYESMKRRHVYMPEVVEQMDKAKDAVKEAKSARRSAGKKVVDTHTQGVRTSVANVQQKVGDAGTQVAQKVRTVGTKVAGAASNVSARVLGTTQQSQSQQQTGQYRTSAPAQANTHSGGSSVGGNSNRTTTETVTQRVITERQGGSSNSRTTTETVISRVTPGSSGSSDSGNSGGSSRTVTENVTRHVTENVNRRTNDTSQGTSRENRKQAMREYIKTQAVASVIDRVGGSAGAAVASGMRAGSTMNYMQQTGVIQRADSSDGGNSAAAVNPMAMAMMMTVMQQSSRHKTEAPPVDVTNVINRVPDGN